MKVVVWLVSLGLMATGQVITFDAGPIGKLPPGWTVAPTRPGGAPRWEILKDGTARTQPYVLGKVSTDGAGGYPMAILNTLSMRDGDVSVRVKPVSGKEEQAGGLVWRYRDENNYYLVRADAVEKNVAVYKVVNGRAVPVAVRDSPGRASAVKHDIPANAWSLLKVSVRGTRFAIYVNHHRILQVDDGTFNTPGRVGLWTRADCVTYFDDFRVYPK